MRHLLDSWPEVTEQLRRADSIALFLDFDGTLAGLRARPEDVWLERATRRTLTRLALQPKLRICVISGRRRSDVSKRMQVPRIQYLGLHGWERNDDTRLSKAANESLRRAMRSLIPRIDGTAGVWVEDKQKAFALHYRGAADGAVQKARTALRGVLGEPFAGGLRVLAGDHVLEVLPSEVAGKGAAARREWRSFPGALPIYLGDDETDESAFAALARGITVRVGRERHSRARFCLHNPHEVRAFLEKLLAEFST